MHRVRMAVRENRLSDQARVTAADYSREIAAPGRGWVVDDEGQVVGFAVVNGASGEVWALFVDPGHERRGHGRRLLETLVTWASDEGCARLRLSTEPGTRAEAVYRAAGWTACGETDGDLVLELGLR